MCWRHPKNVLNGTDYAMSEIEDDDVTKSAASKLKKFTFTESI